MQAPPHDKGVSMRGGELLLLLLLLCSQTTYSEYIVLSTKWNCQGLYCACLCEFVRWNFSWYRGKKWWGKPRLLNPYVLNICICPQGKMLYQLYNSKAHREEPFFYTISCCIIGCWLALRINADVETGLGILGGLLRPTLCFIKHFLIPTSFAFFSIWLSGSRIHIPLQYPSFHIKDHCLSPFTLLRACQRLYFSCCMLCLFSWQLPVC